MAATRCALLLLLALGQAPRHAGCARGGAIDRAEAFIGYKEELPIGRTRGAPELRKHAEPPNAACADKHALCGQWQASGECERNQAFMLSTCALACTACTPASLSGPAAALEEAHDGVLRIRTSAGTIRVALRAALAPRTVAYVRRVAEEQSCTACRFYRAEAVPPAGAVDNFGGPGPPYALVQGSLAAPGFSPVQREGAPLVQRGDACLIGSGPDFFIAVAAHAEWGNGHTVWGRVVGSMAAVDAIAALPRRNETWGETHVTVLVTPLPFQLEMEL